MILYQAQIAVYASPHNIKYKGLLCRDRQGGKSILTETLLTNEIYVGLVKQFPFIATTTEDLRVSYTQMSDNINKLVTMMGLLSMLIGSIGIINTIQVIVRRRTVEIAVLKTLGLQADQITMLFLIEAILMASSGPLWVGD